MKRLALLLLTGWLANGLFAFAARAESPVRLAALSCEHLTEPIGIGDTRPRLSWKLVSERVGEKQTAYEIRAGTSEEALKNGEADLWDSGKVASEESVLVAWSGKQLGSRSRIFWQVRVWDKDGEVTAWSDVASFELGLLDAAREWKGKWITSDAARVDMEEDALAKASFINAGSAGDQSAAVRVVFDLPADAKVRGAIVDAAADGLISFYANEHATFQGATSHTAPFHADFGGELMAGRNVIAIGSAAIRNFRGTGGTNAIAARVVVELEGGKRIELNTDGAWKAAVNPGTNWGAKDFDDSTWAAARVVGRYSAQGIPENATGMVGAGRYFRKAFVVKGAVAKARLYATALGVYEASINGARVGDHLFEPGWTDYNQRVMARTVDVTKLLLPGTNVLGVVLSDGWFAGRVGWMGLYQYGKISKRPLFSGQLEITYADGSVETIATDETWKSGAGEIVGSDLQVGEILDARKKEAWDVKGFDDAGWSAAIVDDNIKTPIVPELGVPVRKLMELAPRKISRIGDTWIVDLGQNMVGHVRLKAKGPAGTMIMLRHGEMLNADGTLYTENLRTAISMDRFTLCGEGEEIFEPEFTFHGFRYVEVTGYPGTLTAEDVRGIVVGSDLPVTGTFECSDTNVNRLYENIVWGQRGNFLSVPTDCPQRDERMGWMGDAQVFAATAARNADVAAFFTKWLVDVDDAQASNGEFSRVAPIANQSGSYPVWGDAGVIIPWEMYLDYADKKFLADNYEHMARWVDYSARTAGTNLLRHGGVGDHLAPGVERGLNPTTTVVDTAYFARSAWILSKSAAILGKTEDAARYEKLFEDIVAAFNHAFVHGDGNMEGGTQTTYSLALLFDLVPENLRAAAAEHLADDVEAKGHLTTGFVGVGMINPALTSIGRSDLAWQLVLTDTYPSWLFAVKHGATTIWERWDGWTPEKGFEASSMNSFNHYSMGSVGAWFYSGAAGIRLGPSSPGYKHFTFAPQFTSRLDYVKATLESPYGTIKSAWHVAGSKMIYDVTIPPNSTAGVKLSVPPRDVLVDGMPITGSNPNAVVIALGPGTWRMEFPRAALGGDKSAP